MPARAFIVTVPMTGSPSVPDLGIARVAWEIEVPGEIYATNLGGESFVLFKIGTDGAKTAFSGAGTDGVMSVMSRLGTDAQLLRAYFADGALKAKAIGWNVQQNSDLDGFLAPHGLQGQDLRASGRDYT